jgi:micrococcal nuclease
MYEYYGNMGKIVDGDTFDIEIDLGFKISNYIRFRMLGIDVYEVRLGKDTTEADKEKGLSAKAYLIDLFKEDTRVKVVSSKTGKYGRYLCELYKYNDKTDEYDISIYELLMEKGYNKTDG